MPENPNKISTPENIKAPEQPKDDKQKDQPQNHPGPKTREEYKQKLKILEDEFNTATADRQISPELKKELEKKLKEEIAISKRLYESNLSLPERIQDRWADKIDGLAVLLQQKPAERSSIIESAKGHLAVRILNEPSLAKYFGDKKTTEILQAIDNASQKVNPKEFIKATSEALEPIISSNLSFPKEFEDVDAKYTMNAPGYSPLNERLYYGVHESIAHFHLADSFAVSKDQLSVIFADGMNKLASIVEKNPSIETINGTSWIVATKTYGEMLRNLGFEIQDPTQEEMEKYFSNETRKIRKALMPREKFLEIFGKK